MARSTSACVERLNSKSADAVAKKKKSPVAASVIFRADEMKQMQ